MKFTNLISLLIFSLLVSCQQQETSKEKISKEIVLCFDHYNPKHYKTPAGAFHIEIPKVSYIDSMNILIKHVPQEGFDTISINCPEAFREVAFSYRNFEYIYYPLMQGDTITISMDSLDYPLLYSKHHKKRDRIYNMNHQLRKGHTHLGLEAKTCLGDTWVIIAQNIDYIRKHKMNRFLKDYCPLDSLHAMFENYKIAYIDTVNLFKQQQLISDEIYDRYNYLLRLKGYEAQRMLNKDSTYYRKMEQEISDKYACYPSYHEFLDYYLWFFNYHIKRTIESQGSHYDWRQTFAELSTKAFQPKSMQILLQRCINEIGENFSAEDLNIYLNKYVKITGDSILYSKIVEQYNLSADASQLLLKDIQGNRVNFQELLEKHKGKVIYIDFWASWCVPCRKEMEPASELRKQYEGKDVVFVYLAYNDTENSWEKAVREEKLSTIETSYFILNSKNSKMLENIDLRLIPRYIIIDKNGKLVEMNAPRPSDKRIKTTLNKYL
ncbi:TlpA family protein disulfide reductase [Bacteroides oleiciplenus]|uniref:Thioredoxin domain-containing protein n=1 Tax=Bacteroides oleiciplenus YIT 12058 TaxID=742727 RepID=K9DRZ6_9BACE|nr:TlpA disulfide reductase family protein [Bacteroides oleiciplenus]EKU87664.1 hypothetical protein HMPREF9447_05123 [Bacteroides oleiciplenus YIT 12058]